MKIRETMDGVARRKTGKELHGHVALEVYDPITGEVSERREGQNTVTTYPQQMINEGNFHYMESQSKILPISQAFAGIILTNAVEDANNKLITHTSEVIAQAANDAYSGTNTRRGSADLTPSGTKALSNGYQYAWDWGMNAGNGVNISSICLTRPALGASNWSDNAIMTDAEGLFETLGSATGSSTLASLSAIDYDNDLGYMVSYSSGTITIDKYVVNCSKLHINGGNALDVGIKLSTDTISQTIDDFSHGKTSISLPGDGYIHIVTLAKADPGLSYYDSIKDYKIDVTNLSAVADIDVHTYSWGAGETGFTPCTSEYIENYALVRDRIPMINGYFYAFCNGDTELAKCSTSDSTITTTALPSNIQGTAYNGPCAVLDNGDFIKVYGNSYYAPQKQCLYYHNGTIKIAKFPTVNDNTIALEANSYGTILLRTQNNAIVLLTCFGHISTVYEVNPPVTKDATKSMRVVYTLTES